MANFECHICPAGFMTKDGYENHFIGHRIEHGENCDLLWKAPELKPHCTCKRVCNHGLDPTKCARCNRRDLDVSAQGGVQSRLAFRPDLLPPDPVLLVSAILGIKAQEYGEWNWRQIPNSDNLAHAITHLFEHCSGDRKEFHVANAICRLLFYLDGLLVDRRHGYNLEYLSRELQARFGDPTTETSVATTIIKKLNEEIDKV